jgi:hypothetical protein
MNYPCPSHTHENYCTNIKTISVRATLYVVCLLLVIPRRMIYNCRRFGTLYLFHLPRQKVRSESPKRRHTIFQTRRKLEIKIYVCVFVDSKFQHYNICAYHVSYGRCTEFRHTWQSNSIIFTVQCWTDIKFAWKVLDISGSWIFPTKKETEGQKGVRNPSIWRTFDSVDSRTHFGSF